MYTFNQISNVQLVYQCIVKSQIMHSVLITFGI